MLRALRNLLGGGKPARERRRTPSAGPCPSVGASLVKGRVVMKVSEPLRVEFWDWLVLSGWREVRMSKNRRKYVMAPPGALSQLARAGSRERDVLYEQLLGSMTVDK